MSRISKNSKEGTSEEIDKAVNEAGGRKLNKDDFKKDYGSKSQAGSSARASKVGNTSTTKMKNLNKSQDPSFDFDLRCRRGLDELPQMSCLFP